MGSMVTFPDGYPLITRWVDSIRFPHELDDPGGNADFFVTLRDGRPFSFLAITPEDLRKQLERSKNASFLSPGMVVVSYITVDAILEAVEEWLSFGESIPALLYHFGVSIADDKDESEDEDAPRTRSRRIEQEGGAVP